MFRILTLVLALCAMPALAQASDRTITVTGVGQVALAPNMATLTVGARHEAGTAAEALARTSAGVRGIFAVLEAAGVAPRDMQTTGLSVSPRWARSNSDMNAPPRITGYVAANSVMVRLRDLDALGGVLDAVITDGANTLGGVSFGLQDPDEAEDDARRLAVEDAMNRATVLASAAGVALGPVLTMSEGGASLPQPRMMMEAMSDTAGVPVAAGELTVSARVNIVFQITD